MTAERPIVSLDGLRGLAALMVVASHGAASGLHLVPGLNLEGIGKHGVYLFFVLSAFLLTRQALRWFPSTNWWADLRAYAVRRFARIFPLYALVLVTAWLLGGPGLGVPLDGAALARHLVLTQGSGIYWSVPVEFCYYLWIPLLAFVLASPLSLAMRWALLGGLLATVTVMFPSLDAPRNSDQLRWYLPVFLIGSWAAWVSLQTGRWRRVVVAEALLPLVLVATVPALWGLPADQWHRHFMAWGLVWALITLLLERQCLPWMAKWLSQRWMVVLGRWCFGLYLLHLPAQALARRVPAPSVVQAWLGLAMAIGLAYLAYRVVERPAMARLATCKWCQGSQSSV